MNKKALIVALAGVGILSGNTPAHAVPPILASIGVFGPSGEVISYEKEGDTIHLRVCAKNTLKSEIEDASGCPLAPGTSEVILSEHDFRDLVNLGLANIDKSVLSPENKVLLERDLTDLPNLDDKRKLLADLQKQLQRVKSFKAENPEDYDANEEKHLEEQISQCNTGLSGYGEIINAKNQVASAVDGLITDMNNKPIKRVLKRSQDGSGIAYNLLRSIASVDACDPDKVAKAPSSYICRAGSVLWKVENDTYAGKRVYLDLKSGMKVTEPLGTSTQYKAGDFCKNGYRLPSGYPARLNGQKDFPNQDSDFVALEKDGIRQVVPGMKDHWLWSSSVNPYSTGYACYFNGNNGAIGSDVRDDDYGAVLCVSGGR